MSTRPITGRQVFAGFAGAFGIIIAVNITLAVKAVQTFPGLEVKNSYVASQSFDADRDAQERLGWTVGARVTGGALHLSVTDATGTPVRPDIISATLGRATHVQSDTTPAFTWSGTELVAPADLAPGNWNLRLDARAADGTPFRQRIVLHVDAPA